MQKVLNKYVQTLGTDGILVSLAGVDNDNSDENNTYSDRIDSINDALDDLKEKLQTEEARYVKKFSSKLSAKQ